MRKPLWIFGAVILVLVLSVCLPRPASAGEIGLKGIEPRLGIVSPEGAIGTNLIFGATADMGNLAEQIRLEFALEYWKDSEGDASFSNFALVPAVRYDFTPDSDVLFFGTAGLGLHFCKASVGSFSDSSAEIGLALGAGMEYPMGDSMNLVGRFGFDINGGADYLSITGGLKFPLGD